MQLLNITVQLENNCTATNGKIYTGYAIRLLTNIVTYTRTKSIRVHNNNNIHVYVQGMYV